MFLIGFRPMLAGGVAVMLGLVSLVTATAQPPAVGPPAPPAKATAPTQTADMIRRALDGQKIPETKDGMLQDVLGLIQKRKSVLHGSLLEQTLAETTSTDAANQPAKNGSVASRAHVAEHLLCSARLLAELQPNTNPQLVRELRRQAFELLRIDFADTPTGRARPNAAD